MDGWTDKRTDRQTGDKRISNGFSKSGKYPRATEIIGFNLESRPANSRQYSALAERVYVAHGMSGLAVLRQSRVFFFLVLLITAPNHPLLNPSAVSFPLRTIDIIGLVIALPFAAT